MSKADEFALPMLGEMIPAEQSRIHNRLRVERNGKMVRLICEGDHDFTDRATR